MALTRPELEVWATPGSGGSWCSSSSLSSVSSAPSPIQVLASQRPIGFSHILDSGNFCGPLGASLRIIGQSACHPCLCLGRLSACSLSRLARTKSVIRTEVRMLGSGVFHGASWGHHETGRVAIVAFLAISTVLLFVSLFHSTLAAWDADQKGWTEVL